MMIQKPVVRIMGEVVDQMNNELILGEDKTLLQLLQEYDPNIKVINYLFGPFVEILQTLQQYDNDPEKMYERYPLIMFIQDFPEENSSEFNSKPTIRMAIAHSTDKNYKAPERYTKVFEPVLYPIYHQLISRIGHSRYFMVDNPRNIPHIKRDRVYWGKDAFGGRSTHEMNDYVDAMELTNMKLVVDKAQCNFYFNP